MQPFNIGDLVTLKSGGPALTIASIRRDDSGTGSQYIVHCQWFQGMDLMGQDFPDVTLVKAVPPSEGMSSGS